MKLLINLSVMCVGVVAIEFDGPDEGKAQVVGEKDFAWSTCQVMKDITDTPEMIKRAQEDPDMKNIAILRILARAHERWQEEVEKSVRVVSMPEVKKETAN